MSYRIMSLLSLFRSKMVWICMVLCVVAVGSVVVVVYQDLREPQAPIKIYKVTESAPNDVSSDNLSTVISPNPQAEEVDPTRDTSNATGESMETPRTVTSRQEQSDAGVSPLAADDPQTDSEHLEDVPLEDLLQIRDYVVEEELTAVIQDLPNTYPILRMSKDELLEMNETNSGRSELLRQSEGIFSTLTRALADVLMLYTPEEREGYYKQTRAFLRQSMPADQVDRLLNQTRDEVESRIRQ